MNLQRVIDVVTERYGEVSSLFQLMEAFLFAGQFAQVRKFFICLYCLYVFFN